MGGKFIGLLAACAVLATFAFTSADRAAATTYVYSVECNEASGVWYLKNAYNPGTLSNIPCDEAKPAARFDWVNPGHIIWVYDGDRAVTPVTSGSRVVGTTVREVQEQGNTRPPVNQPISDVAASQYYADDNNRAIRGTDNHCYREQRINGQWRRSGSYGTEAEACRKARWNANFRSQGQPLVNPVSGTFPSGWPQ